DRARVHGPQPRLGAEAWPGARRGDLRRGASRAYGHRICAERNQASGRRHGRSRQGPDPAHGRHAAEHFDEDAGRCGRRACRRADTRAHTREHRAHRHPAHSVETAAMIGRLKGVLASKMPPWLVVDVGGVGYELEAPMSTVFDLPEIGREVALFTHYAVKEDTVALYGFLREAERTLFRTLQKVSGIGAKTSLAVLSGSSPDEFARLVQTGDIAALTRIPGIGKKTAERIVVELRDRVDGIAQSLPGMHGSVAKDPVAEASSALQQLGYRPVEVARLVKEVAEAGDSAEGIIRKALKAALR